MATVALLLIFEVFCSDQFAERVKDVRASKITLPRPARWMGKFQRPSRLRAGDSRGYGHAPASIGILADEFERLRNRAAECQDHGFTSSSLQHPALIPIAF